MILDLPTDIQEHIYDKLLIEDRVSLNRALPKAHRIRKTIHTDEKKDKCLRLIAFTFKKRKIQPKDIVDTSLGRFMIANKHQPTVRDIMGDLIDEVKNPDVTPLIELLNRIEKNEDITEDLLASINIAEAIPQIIDKAAKHATPKTWDSVFGIPQVADAANAAIQNDLSKTCLLSMVTHMNEDLLAHVTKLAHNEPWITVALEELKLYISCFSYDQHIKVLLKYIPIPTSSLEEMVCYHVLQGNFSAAELYIQKLYE